MRVDRARIIALLGVTTPVAVAMVVAASPAYATADHVYTSDVTVTVPKGVNTITATLTGAGGAGGGLTTDLKPGKSGGAGGGGGGGATVTCTLTNLTAGQKLKISPGAGGNAHAPTAGAPGGPAKIQDVASGNLLAQADSGVGGQDGSEGAITGGRSGAGGSLDVDSTYCRGGDLVSHVKGHDGLNGSDTKGGNGGAAGTPSSACPATAGEGGNGGDGGTKKNYGQNGDNGCINLVY
ncbi:hypothetical protein ACFWF7_29470 [Nocardia sp. NPDC060256]|uniref:glycine-rich domain-containing protein n=1 Tax=unclassified Nocardia TaxID=2637762 RepID=UPI00365B08F4